MDKDELRVSSESMDDAVRITDLSKAYGGKTVFSGLSFGFPRGNVTCVTGPSGCGKTTLLRLLAGLEQPDSGTVERKTDSLSFVFQEDRLCEAFSAVSNLRLVTGDRLSREILSAHLSEVGLSGHAGRPVRDFSGGMKRRVAIVRAVCCNAELLLMDEPFKGLDPELKKQTMEYVKRHTQGKTVIFVTHDPEEAGNMGGEILRMTAQTGFSEMSAAQEA